MPVRLPFDGPLLEAGETGTDPNTNRTSGRQCNMPSPDVDPERLRAAATKLRLAITYADMASQYSTEADPDPWMWGLAGIPMSMLYFPLADGWRDLLTKAGESIDGVATRLEDSGASWEDVDTLMSEEFTKLASGIADAAAENSRDTQSVPLVPK